MSDFPISQYKILLVELKKRIAEARSNLLYIVNRETIAVYWDIGKMIADQEKTEGWGTKVVEKLARDIKIEFPDLQGFSTRNLRYMREFAKAYPGFSILQQPAAKLTPSTRGKKKIILQQPAAKMELPINELIGLVPWTHHLVILDKIKDAKNRAFYLQKTVENRWSRNQLVVQIERELHGRQGKAINNFKLTLPEPQSDLAHETLKSPYIWDFLGLGEGMREKELEKALISHMREFLLELGKGFAFVGNQYNLKVEDDESYLDLLFFNIHLNCYVVFEIKIGEFKPAYAGQLNYYINAIDKQVKSKKHRKTIGVLLCKTPNKTMIRYALEGVKNPIGVSDYMLARALPKEIKSEMPSISELEQSIDEGLNRLSKPEESRLQSLRKRISDKQKGEIKALATTDLLFSIFDNSIAPLFKKLLWKLDEFRSDSLSIYTVWIGHDKSYQTLDEFEYYWKNEKNLKENREFTFLYRLCGLKKLGVDGQDAAVQIVIRLDQYWYGFKIINYDHLEPVAKKNYHEFLDVADIDIICSISINQIMSSMEMQLKAAK